jgi:hypothetical protein
MGVYNVTAMLENGLAGSTSFLFLSSFFLFFEAGLALLLRLASNSWPLQ